MVTRCEYNKGLDTRPKASGHAWNLELSRLDWTRSLGYSQFLVTTSDENAFESGRRSPDGISCVGLLLLVVIVLATVGVGLGGAAFGQGDSGATSTVSLATETGPAALVGVDESEQAIPPATNTATATERPTVTATQTTTAVPTATPSPTTQPTPSAIPIVDDLEPRFFAPTATPDEGTLLGPLPTPIGIYSWTLKVPILMYHYVSEPPEGADKYRISLSVHPETFRQQMQYLADNGYSPVTLSDLSLAIVNKHELPPKPIVITLDDGYRDNYENAFPVMRELGFTATIFVATDFVDRGDPNHLTWDMIKEMDAAGIRFEPHSKTHPDLTEHDRDFILYQIKGSGETLEAHLGYRSRYFAYPSGRYNDEAIQVLSDLDYWGAVTTQDGVWHGFDDRYVWTRVRVINSLSLANFADLID
jgi:peptidoglycan/xylan/chitin deacetylase (PgdA/CDA1 family)